MDALSNSQEPSAPDVSNYQNLLVAALLGLQRQDQPMASSDHDFLATALQTRLPKEQPRHEARGDSASLPSEAHHTIPHHHCIWSEMQRVAFGSSSTPSRYTKEGSESMSTSAMSAGRKRTRQGEQEEEAAILRQPKDNSTEQTCAFSLVPAPLPFVGHMTPLNRSSSHDHASSSCLQAESLALARKDAAAGSGALSKHAVNFQTTLEKQASPLLLQHDAITKQTSVPQPSSVAPAASQAPTSGSIPAGKVASTSDSRKRRRNWQRQQQEAARLAFVQMFLAKAIQEKREAAKESFS